jgi:hypothetical protein
MDNLPQVLRLEIWEYVQGDRTFWQHRQFRLVLTELVKQAKRVDPANDNEYVKAFREYHLGNISNLRQARCVRINFPSKNINVDFNRMYEDDGTKLWFACLVCNGKRALSEWVKTPGPARQDFHRFMILAAEIIWGFRTL